MENNHLDKLNNLIISVIDTLSYYGVKIDKLDISPENLVRFNITLFTDKLKRSVNDTLDIAYWALWCLLFGKYTEDKKESKIVLEYKEEISK